MITRCSPAAPWASATRAPDRTDRGARSLTRRQTDTIGVILPDLFGEFFSEIVRGIDLAVQGAGKSLLLGNMHGSAEQTGQAIRAMRGRVDGLLVMPPHSSAETLDQALALILQSQGLSSREQGNVIVVAPASELAEIERQEIEARSQQQILAPLVTEFIEIKYARAEDLAQLLRGGDGFGLLTERGRVSVDQRTNTLLIQDTAEQVRDIMRTLVRLDVAVRQVQIEARIVIARDSASRELGVNWGVSSTRGFLENEAGQFVPRNINPGGLNRAQGGLAVDLGSTAAADTGFSFGYLSGDILLDLELRALESEGKSQTISQPRVITANQRTATIRQGEERAFQSVDAQGNPDTEFKEAELSLEVTPQITPDNRIIMDLVIKNDSFRESEFGGEPPIDTNQIETQVLVDNGQTVVLGGILTTEQLSQIAKTPLLGDLPILGRLFRYTEESNEKVELLVFITPRLLDDGLAVR